MTTDAPTPDSNAEVAVTSASADTPAGPRAVIMRGGVPSDEQAAALAAALLSVTTETTSTSPRLSGWQRAALVEGVGGPRHAERYDLDGPDVR